MCVAVAGVPVGPPARFGFNWEALCASSGQAGSDCRRGEDGDYGVERAAFSCTSLCISIGKNAFVTVHGIEILAYSVMVHFHNRQFVCNRRTVDHWFWSKSSEWPYCKHSNLLILNGLHPFQVISIGCVPLLRFYLCFGDL